MSDEETVEVSRATLSTLLGLAYAMNYKHDLDLTDPTFDEAIEEAELVLDGEISGVTK